jgi:hypothetical protein
VVLRFFRSTFDQRPGGKREKPLLGRTLAARLTINDGKQVAQGKIERTIPVRFSLDETLDVGMDTGTPVIEDWLRSAT